MLEFVDLDDGFGDALGADEGSATAFFAIPQLKEASRPSPAPPPAAPGPSAPVAAPPPRVASPVAGGPIAGGPVAGGPVAVGAPIAQGPVAEYKAGGPVSPRGPAGGAPVPPPAHDSGRTESKRVAVIILGMFMLLGGATFLAVWGSSMFGDDDGGGRGDPIVASGSGKDPDKGERTTPVVTEADPNNDTGANAPPRETKTKTKTKTRTPTTTGGSGTKAPPKTPSGNLSVKVTGPPTMVNLDCAGHRDRKSLAGGKATFTGVPGSGCKVTFSGHGAKAVFNGVGGGRSLSCTVDGGTANCR